MLHRVVLHRIVANHNGHYTFKGDNNSFTDPEQPPAPISSAKLLSTSPQPATPSNGCADRGFSHCLQPWPYSRSASTYAATQATSRRREHKHALLIALSGAAATMPLVALGANNTLPVSNGGRSQTTITANTLKPAACAAITLTTLISGVTGTANADLLLATAAADTITASGGNDCILGGAGNDNINCGNGTDIAIGGPGTDIFNSNCETRVQ